MKKSMIILILCASSAMLGVAANLSDDFNQVIVIDIGDTKVGKGTPFENLVTSVPLKIIDLAVIEPQPVCEIAVQEYFYQTKKCRPIDPQIKSKLYLLNCAIRQC